MDPIELHAMKMRILVAAGGNNILDTLATIATMQSFLICAASDSEAEAVEMQTDLHNTALGTIHRSHEMLRKTWRSTAD